MSNLIFEPMHVISQRIARGELSCETVTEAALSQVVAHQPDLNPFVTITAELARNMAQAADHEIASGHYRGPLHGVPVVLKDLFETASTRTTGGSKTRNATIPDHDATVVKLLRDAGAIFIGKTGMPEFAVTGTSTNPTYGLIRNPWNPAVDPAGSSSGTGAAIAAGMAWCGPGSDTGGSIRMPASACGLIGLKPTYGRVSLKGVLPLNSSLDHVGPMARCVRDAALLLQVLAGYDPEDPQSRNALVDDYMSSLEAGVQGLRVAVLRFSDVEIEPTIEAAFRAAVCTLESAGAVIEEIEIPNILRAAVPLFMVGILSHYDHLLNEDPDNLSTYFTETLLRARQYTQIDVMVAWREVQNGLHQLERILHFYDLAVSPTLAVYPPAAGELTRGELLQLTAVWNLNGWPAVSVPCGLSPNNIPIGFQIISHPWTEALALRAARVIESHHALSFPPVGLVRDDSLRRSAS